MSQHIVEQPPIKWVYGWDNMLQSFYLQMHDSTKSEEANPVVWLGSAPGKWIYEVDELVKQAKHYGLHIPYQIQVKLYGEKDLGL